MSLSHNDTPTLEDAFANQLFIKGICSLVRDCIPPKGIGLNGYWGTGKTSALLQVYYQLSGKSPYGELPTGTKPPVAGLKDNTIMPVWFEAWRYQYEPQPIVALLNEIRAQMGLWQKFQNEVTKLTGVTFLGVLSAFDEVIKVATGGVFKPEFGKLQEIGKNWENERYQQQIPTQTIQTLLEKAIDTALKNIKKKRLVIFIDDLDRCEPETALRLIEGIKIYLNLENCVIIFGMDQRQVERALAKAMGLPSINADHYAREYLEKICQDIIHLPLADKTRKSIYLSSLLTKLTLATHSASPLKAVTDGYDCLPANPRKIKSLANRIAFMCRRLEGQGIDTTTDVVSQKNGETICQRGPALLLLIAVFSCFHRPIYEQLQKNPAYIQTIFEYASSSATLEDLAKNADYAPMQGIHPSQSAGKELPVNPSDSNVFRMHQLLIDLGAIPADEIKPFLNL